MCPLHSTETGTPEPLGGDPGGHIEECGLLRCFDGSLEGSTDIFRALKVSFETLSGCCGGQIVLT